MIVLPGTTLAVSGLCLGGNRLGGELDHDGSFALLDAFAAAGGTFIDTAHVYADWLPGVERSCSEKMLGRWRAERHVEGLVIATKIGHHRLDAPTEPRLDARSLRLDVAEALSNLRCDRLDLVYLHRDDSSIPAADILVPLEEMVREGLIRHYAASNWAAARLREAQAAAKREGWQGFVANQAEWSLATRNPGTAAGDLHAMDPDMIAWHHETGIAAIPYSTQAKGYFDKLTAGTLDAATARSYDSPPNRALGDALARLAARHGLTPTEVMLAVLRTAPFPVIPVVGCRTPEQIASSVRGLSAEVDPSEVVPLQRALGWI